MTTPTAIAKTACVEVGVHMRSRSRTSTPGRDASHRRQVGRPTRLSMVVDAWRLSAACGTRPLRAYLVRGKGNLRWQSTLAAPTPLVGFVARWRSWGGTNPTLPALGQVSVRLFNMRFRRAMGIAEISRKAIALTVRHSCIHKPRVWILGIHTAVVPE